MNPVVTALLLSLTQTIRIQLESEISLHLTPIAGGAECHVRLADSRGDPIADASLAVTVDGREPAHARGPDRTDARGMWAAPCVRGTTRQRVAVRFAGNVRARGAAAGVVFDPSHAGGAVTLGPFARRVRWEDAEPLRATTNPGATVEFHVEGSSGTATVTTPATVATREGAIAELVVELWRVAPGNVRIEARRVEGDGSVSAVTSALVMVTSAVWLDATARRDGPRCRLTGRLRGAHGPVARAPLTAFVDGEPRHAFESDARGDFSTTFDCLSSAATAFPTIDVRYAPDRPGLERAHRATTATTRAQSLGAVVALCVAAVALLFAALWGVGRLRGSLGHRPHVARVPDAAHAEQREPPAVGVSLARAGSIFQARSTIVAGTVIDAVTQDPIRSARVVLTAHRLGERTSDSAFVTADTDADGRFRFDAGDAGRVHLVIEAPDYMGASVDARLPHRGEYAALRVGLLSIREAIRDLYVLGSARIGVSHARVLRASPNEVVAPYRQGLAPALTDSASVQDVAEFARSFEALFFAPGTRTDNDHAAFENRVARLPDLAPTERDRLPPLHPVGAPRAATLIRP